MTESVPKLRILTIRDQRVLLDTDLAWLYGVRNPGAEPGGETQP